MKIKYLWSLFLRVYNDFCFFLETLHLDHSQIGTKCTALFLFFLSLSVKKAVHFVTIWDCWLPCTVHFWNNCIIVSHYIIYYVKIIKIILVQTKWEICIFWWWINLSFWHILQCQYWFELFSSFPHRLLLFQLCLIFFIFLSFIFMATFLYCSLYSSLSSNFCDSNLGSSWL